MDDFIDLHHRHDLGEQRHFRDQLAGARRDGFLVRGPVGDPDADHAGVGRRAAAVIGGGTPAYFDAMQTVAENVLDQRHVSTDIEIEVEGDVVLRGIKHGDALHGGPLLATAACCHPARAAWALSISLAAEKLFVREPYSRPMRLHPHEGFDNAAASYRHIEAVPLAAAMGAEVRGVDVANLGDDAFAEIQHALFRHKMIFFRDQRIGHAEHRAFTRRFGPFADDAYTTGVPGYPEVQPVIKHADDRSAMVFGSGWHTDSPFLAQPPAISTLRAVQVPPFGGDTMWANSALAWRMLSPTMQGLLGGLRVHFSMRDVLASAQR